MMKPARGGFAGGAGAAALVLAAAIAAAAEPGSWPRFRGPDGAGISNDDKVPVEFSPSAIDWAIDLPGPGHSSPVVWGERIFLTCEGPGGEPQRSILCVGLNDGKVQWERMFDYTPHPQHRFNNAASSTPAVDAERVYVSWTSADEREVIALNHDGSDAWRKVVGPYAEEHGSSASPALAEDVLIVQNDHVAGGGSLLGLDPKTGREIWKHQRSSSKTSFSTPAIFRPERGPVQAIFTSIPTGITSLDARTGELLWEHPVTFDTRAVGSPIVAGDVIIAAWGQGGGGKDCVVLRPPTRSGEKPEVAYSVRSGLPYVPTPLYCDGLVFLWSDGGVLSCLDAKEGTELWSERVSGPCYASPLCIGGKVYGFSKTGEIVVVDAAREFRKLAESKLPDGFNATPAVVDGRLILRTDTQLLSAGGPKSAP